MKKNQNKNNQEYSNLIIVDLLNLDFKHFFSRYKIGIMGFISISLVVALIIWVTTILI